MVNQAQAIQPVTTGINNDLSVHIGDDREELEFRESLSYGDITFEDQNSSFTLSAFGDNVVSQAESMVSVHYDSKYSGTVSISLSRDYHANSGGHSGGHYSDTHWGYSFGAPEGGQIRVSMAGDSSVTGEHAPLSALTKVNNNKIRHRNNQFEGPSSIQIPTQRGTNYINIRSGGGGSYGYTDFTKNASFSLDWSILAPAYRFNAESNSDQLVDARRPNVAADSMIVDVDGNGVYQMNGHERWVSKLLPVDTASAYVLSGEFRALTEGGSMVYFGLESYDGNRELIESYMVNRVGSANVVAYTDANHIVVETPLTGWAAADDAAHKRAVGIYLDGDTTKRPDYYVLYDKSALYSTEASAGGYHSISEQTIGLSEALPDDIVSQIQPGVTVVMNHRQSSSHIYIAGENIGSELTRFERELQGERWRNNHATFRPETKFVKVYVAGNWILGQHDAILQFDDIELRKVDTE